MALTRSHGYERVAWAAWCLYAVTVCAGIARGGMWLDELQVWCLARDSEGVSALLHLIRNEGHPPLWPLLVKGVTLLSDHPMSMAVLHGAFALGTAWLLLLRAPWPLAWRLLAVAGYFVLFEYAVIARNYGPGMFFLFAGVHAWHAGRRTLAMGLMIALGMTHYWGIVAAGAWAVAHLVERTATRGDRLRCTTVLVCACLALWSALPADPLPYTPTLTSGMWRTLPDTIGRMLGQAFLPFPDPFEAKPWNTSWSYDRSPLLHNMLGYACLAMALRCAADRKPAMLFLLLATLGFVAFPALAPFRSIRYAGPVLLVLLAALWTAPVAGAHGKQIAVLILLAAQVPGALFMTWKGQCVPRSMASASTRWLRESRYAEIPVMVHPYQAVPAVSAYLGRPVYCPATGGPESFCRWTHRPFRLTDDELDRALAGSPHPFAILISDDPTLARPGPAGVRIALVARFQGAMITSEEHHLYVVHRPP